MNNSGLFVGIALSLGSAICLIWVIIHHKRTNTFGFTWGNKLLLFNKLLVPVLLIMTFIAPALGYAWAASAQQNLVSNGSFENTGATWNKPWSFTTGCGISATIVQDGTTSVDGQFSTKVNVPSSGNSYCVMLSQSGMIFANKVEYTTSFWAKAATDRPLDVLVFQQSPKYVVFSLQSFTLHASWQKYTFSFTPSMSVSNGVLALRLGDAAAIVWIDAVSVANAPATLPPPTTPQPTATPIPAPKPTPSPLPTPNPTPTAAPIPTATPTPTSNGATWYISPNGNGKDGKSWTTAWPELNMVNWNEIQPGDTIMLDGGSQNMTYSTTLSIHKSGTAQAPIMIKRSTETGHNGKVIFFGKSTVPLPDCGQTSWTAPTGTVGDAIDFNSNSYITLTGNSWDGIEIHGFTYFTVFFSGGESHDTLSDIEIHDNGDALQSGGLYYPDLPGIVLHGTQSFLTFNGLSIHDNGQDALQSNGGLTTVVVENSWFYYSRTLPGVPSESYNLCTHNDGLQIFGSTSGSNLTFQHDLIGPGGTNGLIFQPTMTNITITDDLFIGQGSNVTVENSSSASGWHISNITTYAPDDNLTLEGSGNTITKSILYGGNVLLNNSATSSSNCYWQTTITGGSLSGINADPRFKTDLSAYPGHTNDIKQYPALSFLQNANFALQDGSPCSGLGSSITSVNTFLASVGG